MVLTFRRCVVLKLIPKGSNLCQMPSGAYWIVLWRVPKIWEFHSSTVLADSRCVLIPLEQVLLQKIVPSTWIWTLKSWRYSRLWHSNRSNSWRHSFNHKLCWFQGNQMVYNQTTTKIATVHYQIWCVLCFPPSGIAASASPKMRASMRTAKARGQGCRKDLAWAWAWQGVLTITKI